MHTFYICLCSFSFGTNSFVVAISNAMMQYCRWEYTELQFINILDNILSLQQDKAGVKN